MKFAFVPAVTLALLAGACATGPTDTQFAPRADANLRADLAECQTVADSIDVLDVNTYSDTRYSVAAALASQVQMGNVSGMSQQQIFTAVRDSCMVKKGWTVQAQ